MRQLLEDKQTEPTVVREDNQSAIAIAQQPHSHSKMKHIDIRYHFIREKVQDNAIELWYCPTNNMLADILTKGLTYDKFSRLHELSGVKDLSDFKWGVLENMHSCQTYCTSVYVM